MVFNAPAHRNNLQTLQNYVATAVFITHLGWKQDGSGHTLVDKSDREEKVCIVVAKVLDYRMNCSPIGSYRKEYPPLAKAKFQFSVGKPEEGALAKDFDEAIKTLSKAQGTIATTQDRRNMLVTEGSDNNIRFTAPIFQKRDTPIIFERTPPPGNEGVHSPSTEGLRASSGDVEKEIDEETNEWKVPSEFQEELDEIKTTHRVVPLKVYMGQQFVEPVDVPRALEGALVEVHFTINHYRIGRDSPMDSFSAIVQQVLILKSADQKKSSPYKRKNWRDGPVRVAPPPGEASKITKTGKNTTLDNPFVTAAHNGDDQTSSFVQRLQELAPARTESEGVPPTVEHPASLSTAVSTKVSPDPTHRNITPPPSTNHNASTTPVLTDGPRKPVTPEPESNGSSAGGVNIARATRSNTNVGSSVAPEEVMTGNNVPNTGPNDDEADLAGPSIETQKSQTKKLSSKAAGKQKAVERGSTPYNFRDGPRVQKP